jgi:phosphatidyl-myo-inositol dimannoside synthase
MAASSHLLFAMTGAGGLCGGIHTANLNILHALVELADEKGAGLTVLSLHERQSDRPDWLPAKARFFAFAGNQLTFSARMLREAVRRPVICFDHVTLALPLLPLVQARVIKSVVFAHGSEAWKRVRKTSVWSLQSASLCLTNSHFTLKRMQNRIAEFHGVACPLGLSPEVALNTKLPNPPESVLELEAANGKTYPLGERVLLLVARMHPAEREKGHDALIDVLPEVVARYPETQLVFAGPGDDRENLIARARARGVASSVFIPGFVPVSTLQELYRRCYAFVMPSKQEGFGLVYLEAMNYAKPCLGCFDDGAEDVISDRETGLLIRDPKDSRELLSALCALLDDPQLAGRLGRNGFKRLHQRFTSHHYQQRVKAQIASLL